jgi:hypothetical protein
MNRRQALGNVGVALSAGLAGSQLQASENKLVEIGWIHNTEFLSNHIIYTPHEGIYGHLPTWKPQMTAKEMAFLMLLFNLPDKDGVFPVYADKYITNPQMFIEFHNDPRLDNVKDLRAKGEHQEANKIIKEVYESRKLFFSVKEVV